MTTPKNESCECEKLMLPEWKRCDSCMERINKFNEKFFKKDKPTITLPFQVGDICEAFGLECVVRGVEILSDYPIQVNYFSDKTCDSFTSDGRLYNSHKTPSLKLIRRPEPVKVEEKKIYEYQYVYKHKNSDRFLITLDWYKNRKEFRDAKKNIIDSAKRLARSKKIRGEG